jgi:hypothetical protein
MNEDFWATYVPWGLNRSPIALPPLQPAGPWTDGQAPGEEPLESDSNQEPAA